MSHDGDPLATRARIRAALCDEYVPGIDLERVADAIANPVIRVRACQPVPTPAAWPTPLQPVKGAA